MRLRTVLAGALVLFASTGSGGAQSSRIDADADGRPDSQEILQVVNLLRQQGVTFNDEDSLGHRPVIRNGRYQMACVDLLLVAYRAAGYDLCSAMRGGPLLRNLDAQLLDYRENGGNARRIASLIPYFKRAPEWRYFDAAGADPLDVNWVPRDPFQVGDMLFLHYVCDGSHDRHSGIVTAVDPTGRPVRVAQISSYNPNEDLQEVTMPILFRLWCRRLTGHSRPAAWDAGVMAGANESRQRRAVLEPAVEVPSAGDGARGEATGPGRT